MPAIKSTPKPECKPIADYVGKVMRERHLTLVALAGLVNGHDAKGAVRGTGHASQISNGHLLPSGHTVKRWQQAGVDIGPAVEEAKALRAPKHALTPVRAAVAAFEKAIPTEKLKPAPVHESRRVGPPLFALSIDQEGKSNITLNLLDITSEEALRCIGVLTAANLIVVRK
jgi:hypothetical protein